jgi:hypothetical protein
MKATLADERQREIERELERELGERERERERERDVQESKREIIFGKVNMKQMRHPLAD